ncbi:anthranilate phosphoribosyltransferase [Candidatus Woesearchaeota archaeon]|nr:anthranilate phosphoribosyltransferase [Candidatus Woesearchaeota archaeon]
MNIAGILQKLLDRQALDRAEMREVMQYLMSGQASPARISALLVALCAKGETVQEVAAAAQVLRELSIRVEVAQEHLIDTCGTGGDARHTFNISTAAAFVAAAAGARVAKHGNRSVSSRSGSADVLEAAGVRLDLQPEQVKACIEQMGLGFLFAQRHHEAMRHLLAVRKEIGIRTVFNLLGPLINPAGAPNQLLGVYSAAWVEPLADVLRVLGSQHVLVVQAEDGLDEISIGSPTRVAELKDGQINTYTLTPERFGLSRAPLDTLVIASAAESHALIRRVFQGEKGPARDIVMLNAAAALYVANVADSLETGLEKAGSVLDSGLALEKLENLATFTQSLPLTGSIPS